jgi:hypothetical protein
MSTKNPWQHPFRVPRRGAARPRALSIHRKAIHRKAGLRRVRRTVRSWIRTRSPAVSTEASTPAGPIRQEGLELEAATGLVAGRCDAQFREVADIFRKQISRTDGGAS